MIFAKVRPLLGI